MPTMAAWEVATPGPIEKNPLVRADRSRPVPGPGELLLRVRACAVCRTDLHVAEGDLPPHRSPVVPGHQIVGEVVELGGATESFAVGDRAGVAWLRYTCGHCRFCRRGAENLCLESRYTGWDADGGYAEYAVAPASYAYHLPESYTDEEVAPLLCAGIIGYRALNRCNLPEGGVLGIYGFGSSAHLTLQMALAQGARVHVRTRSAQAQRLASDLGAASSGATDDRLPEPLDAAILFAPAGAIVPTALSALDRGGVLSIAGVHLSDIPSLDYDRYLFGERDLRSVTANTRQDGREFLALAGRHKLTIALQPYPFARADRALADLAADRVDGVAVLRI